MSKTLLLGLLLAIAACAQPDQEDSDSLLEDEQLPATQGGDEGACADEGDFDVEVFVNEIKPIIAGEIDLNDPDSEFFSGCARSACHGNLRPDGYQFDFAGTPESNVERFACFVNLERPKLSQFLLCPTNDERCAGYPHPGVDPFTGPEDLNYKRILAYIKASRP